MQKLLFVMIALSIMFACTQSGSKNAGKDLKSNTEVPQTTGPDGADLLRTLQGRWQSASDATYVLEVTDDRIKHWSNGQVNSESVIEIDSPCQTVACNTDTTHLTDGWCFIEKGKFDAQCVLVIACDKSVLKFSYVGATAPPSIFNKID